MSLGQIGKYELLDKLSEGGMGVLYRARTVGPGGFERIVALKRIRAASAQDAKFQQMFAEEAKVASLLSHQNLVHLYDFGTDGEAPYLAMEMVEGHDLAQILGRCRQQRTPFPLRCAVRVAQQTALGLDYLHRVVLRGEPLRLVHRDVSPQNIMVSFDGAVKLTDFGIVRIQSRERVTRLGIVKGKLGYLSPEQVSDQSMDSRSDLFSLGIVLWECLTGGRLFSATSDLELVHQTMTRPIRPPSALNSEVPRELDTVVLQLLERDRSRRLSSAAETALALERLVGCCATEAEVAAEMRRLYPEAAAQRVLALSTSPALLAVPPEKRVTPRPESQPGTTEGHEIATALLTVPARPAPAPAEAATVMLTIADTQTESRARPSSRWRGPVVAVAAGAFVAALAWGGGHRWGASPETRGSTAPAASAVEPAPTLAPAPEAAPVTALAPVVTPLPTTALAQGATLAAAPPPPAISAHAPGAARKHAKTATGTLAVVDNDHWADVSLDGKSLGFSPRRWPIAAGHHLLTLKNSQVGVDRRFSIEVAPGQTLLLTGPLKSLQPRTGD